MNKVPKFGNRQKGLAAVEFAIVGALAITLVMAVLEISRAMFVANALGEATRRGARMAVVCPVNDPAIAEVATFNAPGGGTVSPLVKNLDTSDFEIAYLNGAGGVIDDPEAGFFQISYVRVRVTNFQHTLIIPFVNVTFTMPQFTTILPRESLGIPREGDVVPC